MNVIDKSVWKWVFLAWVISLVSTLGSLFFSEVMLFFPCALCWYQRIFMYPLVVLFLVPLFTGTDRRMVHYTLPMVVMGWIFALYHNLVLYEIIPESAAPCAQGIPCSTQYINWFGFITIPMLALLAFSLMIFILLAIQRRLRS